MNHTYQTQGFKAEAELPQLSDTLPEHWILHHVGGFPAFDMLNIPSGCDPVEVGRLVYVAAATLFSWSQSQPHNDVWKGEFWGSRCFPIEIQVNQGNSISADVVVFTASTGTDHAVVMYEVDDKPRACVIVIASCASHLLASSSELSIEQNVVSAVEVSRAVARQ